jgi:hypothetical protein
MKIRAVRYLPLALVLAVAPHAQERPLPDREPFLQEVRRRLQTDNERQRGYVYVETRREQKLDKAFKPTGESVEVFESYPGLPGEERWERLIAKDGKPVPPNELVKSDRERQKHVEEYARRLAQQPVQEHAKQVREYEEGRRENREAVDDIFLVYDIRMLGRESLEGHDTIALSLTPRRDAKPRTRDGKAMRKFNARVWISEADHELVRLEVEAFDTVSFGFGLFARLHKGSRMSFQRRWVNNEAWLPASATYSVSARLGLVALLRRGGSSECSHYPKFSVDTSSTYTPPASPDR